MRIVMLLFAILAWFAGGAIFAFAKTALHEIEAFILFLIGSVLISGAAIIEALVHLRREMVRLPGRFATTETCHVTWKGANAQH